MQLTTYLQIRDRTLKEKRDTEMEVGHLREQLELIDIKREQQEMELIQVQ